jgi:hypothetical protein
MTSGSIAIATEWRARWVWWARGPGQNQGAHRRAAALSILVRRNFVPPLLHKLCRLYRWLKLGLIRATRATLGQVVANTNITAAAAEGTAPPDRAVQMRLFKLLDNGRNAKGVDATS